MTPRALGVLAPVVTLLAAVPACKSGALPTWEASTLEPTQAPQTASEPAGEGEPVAAAETAPDAAGTGEAGAPESSGEPADTPGHAAAKDGEGPAKDAGAKKAPPPLPKPLYPDADPSCGKGPGIGRPLASFSLPSPDGKTINPRRYRGRVLLVNFWGTWCKPCLEELPAFDRLYRRYRRHGLTLVAVATDEDPAPVREFVARKKLAAKVAYKGEGEANRYGSDRFPFSFVVDAKGIIVASYRGYEPRCMGQLEADVRKALRARNRH